MIELHERLTRVETTLAALGKTMDETADDVKTIRNFMVSERARRAAITRTLQWIGGVLTGLGSLYLAFGSAIAKIFQ